MAALTADQVVKRSTHQLHVILFVEVLSEVLGGETIFKEDCLLTLSLSFVHLLIPLLIERLLLVRDFRSPEKLELRAEHNLHSLLETGRHVAELVGLHNFAFLRRLDRHLF